MMRSMQAVTFEGQNAVIFGPNVLPTIITLFHGPGGHMATEVMHPKGMVELDTIHCSLIVASAARLLADCYGLPLDDILDKAKEVCMNPRPHILEDSGRMTMKSMDLEEVDEDDEDDE